MGMLRPASVRPVPVKAMFSVPAAIPTVLHNLTETLHGVLVGTNIDADIVGVTDTTGSIFAELTDDTKVSSSTTPTTFDQLAGVLRSDHSSRLQLRSVRLLAVSSVALNGTDRVMPVTVACSVSDASGIYKAYASPVPVTVVVLLKVH